jgi:ribonuclease-3 family protein
MSLKEAADLEPRALAHLGDAVFHLFEREREIRSSSSAKQMHARARVKATLQSSLLEKVKPALIQEELEIVRRARNVKAPGPRKGGQAAYRRATAFEALLGYLYLTDRERLKAVLALTLDTDDACVSETELKP